MYTFTENSLNLQIAVKVYSLLELAREALGVFLAMCFWLTDHILNVVNRGFLSARFLLVEGPSLKLLHQQSLQESTVQQNRGGNVHQQIQSTELWQRKPWWGEKKPRRQQPAQPLVEYVIIKTLRDRCDSRRYCWKGLFTFRTPNSHNHPPQSNTREQSLLLWQSHIAEERTEV